MVNKQICTKLTAELVTFDTTLPFEEVTSRLDAEINKIGSLSFMSKFQTVATKSKEEIESLINSVVGPSGFLWFLQMNHGGWMNSYEGKSFPPACAYTIGNPLLASTFMKHDIRAGLNIPPRLLVLQKNDGSGTNVIYLAPSSIVDFEGNHDLAAALKILDEKLQALAYRITDA